MSGGRGLLREGGGFLPLLFERLCAVLELPGFVARLAQLRCLLLNFVPRRRQFARQGATTGAFLVERLTMLHRTCGQLLSRSSSLLREGGGFLPLLFERLCAVLELPGFVARLAQLRCLLLNFVPRRRQFARQGATARAFLVERLTMLRHTCGQLLSHSCGLLLQGGGFLPLLFERLCAVLELPGFVARLQQRRLLLNFVPRGLGQLIHQTRSRRLQRLSPLRRGRLHGLLGQHGHLRPRLHCGLIGLGLPPRRQ